MTTPDLTQNEAWAIAGRLSGRYGRLALTRAASEAAAAEKTGNKELSALWLSVVTHLRMATEEMPINEAS